MAATTTPEDRLMVARLGRAYANPENRQWAEAYFDTGTHGKHSAPNERARHEAHVAAVAQLQADIQQDHAAAAYRAQGYQSGASRQQMEVEIQKTMADPSYGDANHPGHRLTMDRVTYLYKQLHPST